MRQRGFLIAAAAVLVAAVIPPVGRASADSGRGGLSGFRHIVVLYQENHSFDNLFGTWEGVDGLANAGRRAVQIGQDGRPLPCLPQNDGT